MNFEQRKAQKGKVFFLQLVKCSSIVSTLFLFLYHCNLDEHGEGMNVHTIKLPHKKYGL